jgi:hypothetical protein
MSTYQEAVEYELKMARRKLEDYRVPIAAATTPSNRDTAAFLRAVIEVETLERLQRAVTG